MEEIKLIADKYDLKIIEDSADTLGASINGFSSGIIVICLSLVFMDRILLIVLVMVELFV